MDRQPGRLAIEKFAADAWPQVARVWGDLVANSPYTTFFLSSEWVEAWLEVFGSSLPVEILIFRDSQRAVGACLLVRRTLRYGPFPVRCVFVNTTGEDEGQSPVIEFNNLLCLADWEQAVAAALISYINVRPWDEVWLNGFCQGPPLDALNQACSGIPRERVVRANFWVDLQRLRESGASYESVLGSKDRARLRQNFRSYGETEVVVPQDVGSALGMFQELAELHTKSWQSRNEPGAFAQPVFRAFHEGLIRRCIVSRGVQLVLIRTASGPIGILYNMIYRGKVYFYQSGLAYSTNKRVRPGFVCLARTIQYCVEQPGLEEFHLMAGGDHYKEPMSTGRQELEWIVLQKANLKNKAIRTLRHWKRRLFARRQTTVAAEATES